MNNHTQTLLDLAYRDARRERGRQPSVANVRRHLNGAWADARENTIAMWADRIIANIPRARLIAKLDLVWSLLIQAHLNWEWPWDEDETVHAVAWGLATLRWLENEKRGRTPPRPALSNDEIAAYLAAKETRQLSLWPTLAEVTP
jgi:hypothetical protein